MVPLTTIAIQLMGNVLARNTSLVTDVMSLNQDTSTSLIQNHVLVMLRELLITIVTIMENVLATHMLLGITVTNVKVDSMDFRLVKGHVSVMKMARPVMPVTKMENVLANQTLLEINVMPAILDTPTSPIVMNVNMNTMA